MSTGQQWVGKHLRKNKLYPRNYCLDVLHYGCVLFSEQCSQLFRNIFISLITSNGLPSAAGQLDKYTITRLSCGETLMIWPWILQPQNLQGHCQPPPKTPVVRLPTFCALAIWPAFVRRMAHNILKIAHRNTCRFPTAPRLRAMTPNRTRSRKVALIPPLAQP